ncbi:MAG: ABC transporter ATP-binding protein [Phycisphaerales bacterium]|nr:ABC transporter ATP-binding protein [Phycisphaerales bacterium]
MNPAGAPGEVMIRARNLGKRFKIYRKPTDRVIEWVTGRSDYHKDFWAVRGVSFEVRRGSCLGVIGANGSGKSTLLKMITGALYPTEGDFRVTGRVLSLIELGTGLHPLMTGRANIINAARLLGFPVEYARERIQEIEAFADIGEFFEREVRVYSTGMRVRLAFAMFACFRPEVFIVDEALSVGDVFFQQKCAARLREMLDAGMTMLFVSHDQSAILNLCDHAIQLEHGRIMYEGAPHETIQRYSASLQKRPKYGKARQTPRPAPAAAAADSGNAADEVLSHSIIPEGADRFGAQNAVVRAVRVTDARGSDTLRGFMGEVLTVHALIEAVTDVQEPGAGLHVVDRFSNILFACGTRSMGIRLPDLAAGESIVVRFDLTLDLRPDTYTLGVGTSVPSADSAEGGFVNDRVQNLGPLLVMQDRTRIRPFYGVARLPLRISAGTPLRCGAPA